MKKLTKAEIKNLRNALPPWLKINRLIQQALDELELNR